MPNYFNGKCRRPNNKVLVLLSAAIHAAHNLNITIVRTGGNNGRG
ncbi:hypothetical protein BVRB_3g056110 [Beta vulgaris subsp. vulgaris]|nr:hypothetical protein BVRB_3g056110 [Beta vulgaris subsp. vulgaris]